MSVTLRVMSDLHLEHDRGWMIPVMDGEADQVLILAGDIVPFTVMYQIMPFFEDISKRFRQVIYVPGNHEYYGGDIVTGMRLATYKLQKLRNIKLLHDDFIRIDNTYIYGTTLWTSLNGAIIEKVPYMVADYKCISNGKRRLTPARTMWDNEHSRCLIRRFNDTDLGANKVLVTHHPINYDFMSPRWVGSESNPMFYNTMPWDEVDDFECVISGHTHDGIRIDDEDKQGYINPRGYPSEGFMGNTFNPFLTVEI